MADPKKPEPAKPEDPRVAAAKERAAAMAKASPSSPGQFVSETLSELKKTTWPDRQTLFKSTYVVLAFITATAIWAGGLDFVMTRVTAPLFGR